jgi:hypothetical protein
MVIDIWEFGIFHGLGFRVECHWFVCETTCMGVW